MKINILTIFPELFNDFSNYGMIKKAIDSDLININTINIREYSIDKHKKVDDYVYGPGSGMLLKPEPIHNTIINNNLQKSYIINVSPRGQKFTQNKAKELSKLDNITFLAGRYEGIDQRIIDLYVDEEISIGDYILTGGEIPIQVIIESTIRLIPGVLNNNESFEDESFTNNLLEEDQYTRPYDFLGMKVPDVLLNGNHQKILEWKNENKLNNTLNNRPDLIRKDK